MDDTTGTYTFKYVQSSLQAILVGYLLKLYFIRNYVQNGFKQ